MTEQARERYRQRQWQARRGGPGAADRRGLKFDESGYRVAKGRAGFVRRVARRLMPL